MKSVTLATLLMCFAIVCVADAQVVMTLVASPDAPGNLPLTALQQCVVQLAHEWNISVKDLPKILIFHVSEKSARPFLDSEVAIRRNSGSRHGEYYEVWIVGDPGHKYILALENVLEYHFRMKLSDSERAKVLARVARLDDSTVSVSDLQGK